MNLILKHKGLIMFYVGVILISFIYSARIDNINELERTNPEIVNSY